MGDATEPSIESSIPAGQGPRPWHFLVAAGSVSLALAVKLSAAGSVPATYLFFLPAIMLSAVLGGAGPGLLATVASSLLVSVWVLDPVGRLEIARTTDAVGLVLFLAIGMAISLGADRYLRRKGQVAAYAIEGRELREARDAARRRTAELEAVLDAVPVGVFITRDSQAQRMEGNRVGCKMLNIPPASNASKTAPPGERPQGHRLMRDGVEIPGDQLPIQVAAARGEEVRACEFDVLLEDGTVRQVVGNATPLRDGDGRPAGAVGAFVDVTELRRSGARLRALVESGADLIVVVGTDGTIQFASPNVHSTFGRELVEVEGASAFEFVHPDDHSTLQAALSAVLAAPDATGRVEARFLHKDGTWRMVEATARNLLHDPAVQGVVINARDVTEQRLLQAEFRQAQKMESVGRLAGGVAHDFNNLLTVILSATEELKRDAETGAPVDLELLADLGAAGERARDLTRQLLAFARKQVVAPAVLDLNTVVRRNEKMLRRVLGEDVEVAVALQDGLWLTFADAGQVEQVLLNLVVNARDAMLGGGRLTLETRNVDGAEGPRGQTGQWVCLVVRDSGCGMSAEVKAHLFEPFFTTKGPGKGTGLGLATAFGIVSQSGGHIRVHSEPGQGATFEVFFPRTLRSSRQAPGAVAEGAIVSGTETVLVVEDDPGVRKIAVDALRANGYEVLTAADGTSALELGSDDLARLQLLVTDVVMPGVDGRGVAEELRRRRPGLPVLFMSGFTQDAFVEGGPEGDGAQFLAKPFTAAEFLDRVRALLDQAPVEA